METSEKSAEEIKKNIQEYKALGPKAWWAAKTKKKKISFILSLVLVAVAITCLFLIIFSRQVFGNDIADTIIGPENENGFIAIGKWFQDQTNLTKIVNTLVTMIVSFLIAYVITLIVRLSTFKGKKARTVGSLIKSFVKWLTILIDIFTILSIWGVDVTTLLASVGVLTLIIGLGCQSLINDVISGLFLVLDESFSVGDIVVIDGFRGTIKEIGLKSTKIIDAGGNIKSISNSAISTVVNLTEELSVAICDCDISYNEDIDNVEGIIKANLNKMKKAIPAIKDCSYVGITSLADSGVTLRFIAHCTEDNRYQVVRDMNKWIYKLFTDNNILIPYNQIVVNPPDPMPAKKNANPTVQASSSSTPDNK
ncbi:MAG: mechanosensitive ion channel family protein [Bacilli bacterium]